jgi:hypothetical protein
MKKEYRTPEMEIVAFETEDIITNSGIDDDSLIIDGTWNDDSIDEELV